MKNLFLALTSIFLLIAGVFFLVQETNTPAISLLAQKIDQDLIAAQQNNFFPETIHSLSQIQITTHSQNKIWKERIPKSIHLPFDQSPDGKYSLQIDAIENFTPDTEAILILQFNLFENMTKNKIWESSRIYHLDKSDLTDLAKIPKT